ncbi:MAG: tetratricopeptide repeat protein [Chloroflexi bacterium]|nr:tetratricopeptide repeat protein [Chloroflexota bacterium]
MARPDTPFDPYLPRLLSCWLAETPHASHREIDGTLVFVDIAGFTALSERLARRGKVGAEEVTHVLNACFSRLLDVARADGGDLIKFGGDALLLFFWGERHCARACHAAGGMRRLLRQTGTLGTSAGRVSLRMSVGVHSGPVHFFLAGDSHRELVVTGPAASQTVAMESAAGAGDILLSPEAARRLGREAVGASQGGGFLLRKPPSVPPGWDADGQEPAAGSDLTPFVPEALRGYLGAGEGEHRQVVVGFVRFTGTDALLATGEAGETLALLDEVIGSVQTAASAHGVCFLATDIDRDGGKVILSAGAPGSLGSDEERMLRTLRAIADGRHGLELRIGVNRGHVFAGEVGPAYRRTYTVMGDAVNLAARLMQRAAPGQVLATAHVLDRSQTVFQAAALEPFAVKGKRKPVTAFSVGAIAGAQARPAGRGLPLIGREEETGQLLAALASARAGRGNLVELVGEPGMGKSRLIEELKARCAADEVLTAVCQQYESSTPYFPFRQLLRTAIGLDDMAGEARARDRLAKRVRASSELTPWLPLLGVPLDLSFPETPETSRLEPAFRRARLHQIVSEFLAKARSGPTVMVFEDAHWMDEASAEFLRHLLSTTASRPWLVCVTRRPQTASFAAEFEIPSTTITLGALPPAASAELARAAAGELALPEHRVAALSRRSGGNPLFLQELVASSQAPGGMETLPENVEAAITARLDTLPPRDRNLLRYASVLGPSFELDLLTAVLPEDVPNARDPGTWSRLDEFVEAEAPGSLRFRHALFRDVAYEALPYRRRWDLHGRIGEVLERQAAAHPEEIAELLSLHFYSAERHDRAWRYSLVAGDRARSKFANVEAADFYRRALDVARRLPSVDAAEVAAASEALGDVCELAGLYTEASTAYHKARRLLQDDRNVNARLLLKTGVLRERSGHYSQALRWYGRGLRLIGRSRPPRQDRSNLVQLSVAYAGTRYRQGRYRECIRWCRRAVDQAKAIGEKAGLAHAYFLLDAAYTDLGRPEEGLRYRNLALPIYEELGDLVGQANVLNNLGIDAYYEGSWDHALALYQRSREAREKAGDVVGAATAANNIGEILSDQGRLSEAEDLFREALRVWRGARYLVGIALATSNLGRAAARAGRFDEAGPLLHEALARFREINAASFVLETEARIAEQLLFQGQHRAARTKAMDLLERAKRSGGTSVLQAMLLRLHGCTLPHTGDTDAAQQALTESLRQARSVGAEFEAALTLDALARLAGDKEGNRYASESRAILRRLGVTALPAIPPPVA